MKRISTNVGIMLMLLLVINPNAFSQNIIKHGLDSVVSERSKNIYSYDDNGKNILNAGYHWDDTSNNWKGDYKYEYAYDYNGNQILYIYYNWDNTGDNWIGNFKMEFMYKNNDNPISRTYYNWNKTSNNWKEDAKSKDEYMSHENERLHTHYTWDYENSNWIEDSKNKQELVYDENNNLTLYAYYTFNYTANTWRGSNKNECIYDNDGRRLNIYYTWDYTTNDWKMISKSEKIFDLSYSITDLIVPVFLYYDYWHERIYTYDYGNMLTEEISSSSRTGTDWEPGSIVKWYWSKKNLETKIPEITNNNFTIRVFPNPTTGQLIITGQLTNTNYEIYNLRGQLQKQGKLQGETTIINIESLARGMYLLRIAGETVKIMKE